MFGRIVPRAVGLAMAIGFGLAVRSAPAADDAKDKDKPLPDVVSFSRDVLPILRTNCHGCHQPAVAKGEYVMTSFAALVKGGETKDVAIVPGKPDESTLVSQITPDGGKVEMPKDKPPLADREIKLIRQWIAQGAKDDSPAMNEPVVDADHPPVYKLPPVITSLDYSPDGSILAVSGYHEVLLHKVAGGGADGSGLVGRLVGLSERIESAVFSPDGKSLAVTGGLPGRMGEVQIWDVEKKKLKLSVPVTFDTIYGGSWSHDGRLVAFGCGDNTIRAVEAETGKQVLYNGAHNDWVIDTVFSAKSTHLMTASRDRSVKLIEVATQRFVDNITSITPGALKGGLSSLDRHPTKDEIIIGGVDGVPKIYKMVRTQARQIGDDFNLIRAFPALPGRLFSVRYSRDGNRVVAGSSHNGTGEVRVFDANNAKEIVKLEDQSGGVYTVTFNKEGNTVASAGFDGFVRLNDATTGKLIKKFVPVELSTGTP